MLIYVINNTYFATDSHFRQDFAILIHSPSKPSTLNPNLRYRLYALVFAFFTLSNTSFTRNVIKA